MGETTQVAYTLL
ncbi:hypothetical protein LINPERPRIM_LOCUS32152 [Linum perenne]